MKLLFVEDDAMNRRVVAILVAVVVPVERLAIAVAIVSLLSLALLGAVAARAGGAPIGRSVLRVTFWGALAMALTAGIGRMFGGIA